MILPALREGGKELDEDSLLNAGGNAIGSTWYVTGQEVLEVTETLTNEAVLESLKNVALEGSKKIGQEVIKDGSGVLVKEAVV